jgi:poly(3-hydroxybutyrate) depolymerase
MRHQMHAPAAFVAVLALVSLLGAGCGDTADDQPVQLADTGTDGGIQYTDDCQFAQDGVCDEPANCELGTDSTDCRAACLQAGSHPYIGAACEFRGLTSDYQSPEQYPNAAPSGGDATTTGWMDRRVSVTSGQDDVDSAARHYRVFVPDSYDPDTASPLMITMPGHRVSHFAMSGGFSMLHRAAMMNDAIVVYAGQEFRGRWAWWSEWYGSQMDSPPDFCKQGTTDNHPDYEFIRKIVDDLKNEYNIDMRRLWLSGHSRGAALALTGAIDMPDFIAGAVVQSGFLECGYLDAKLSSWDGRHVPLVFVHGVQDPDIPIDNVFTPGTEPSDPIVDQLKQVGWTEGDNLRYYRLENLGHDWQPQLTQQWWPFLANQPLPESALNSN